MALFPPAAPPRATFRDASARATLSPTRRDTAPRLPAHDGRFVTPGVPSAAAAPGSVRLPQPAASRKSRRVRLGAGAAADPSLTPILLSPPPPFSHSGPGEESLRHGAHVSGNDGRYIQQGYDRHVADLEPDGRRRPNLVSVMERNDLDEFLALAELSDRDFTAERRGAVVVSMGDSADNASLPPAVSEARAAASAEAKRAAEKLHADSLAFPDARPGPRHLARCSTRTSEDTSSSGAARSPPSRKTSA